MPRNKRVWAKLADREKQVVEGLLLGLALSQVAHEIGISPAAAQLYRRNAIHKLGAKNAVHMAAIVCGGVR